MDKIFHTNQFFLQKKSFREILLANCAIFKALSFEKIQKLLLLIINLSKYAALAELEKANEIVWVFGQIPNILNDTTALILKIFVNLK
jgi:hypothetical protein